MLKLINLFIIINISFSYINHFSNKKILVTYKGKKNNEIDKIKKNFNEFDNPKKTYFKNYLPKTYNQHQYLNKLQNNNIPIIIGVGPAGTGKTLFSCINAIDKLKNNEISKIVLTRPIVAVEDEELGFLPGNIARKMDPWTKPLFDILTEFYKPRDIKKMMMDEIIEISPLAFMRGRTFKNTYIIADEMQNSTPNQMLMLLTRVGENSKLIITGDINQSDRCNNNGLVDLMLKLKNKNVKGIEMVEMNNNDIQRSKIVYNIIKLYNI